MTYRFSQGLNAISLGGGKPYYFRPDQTYPQFQASIFSGEQTSGSLQGRATRNLQIVFDNELHLGAPVLIDVAIRSDIMPLQHDPVVALAS